MAQRTRFDIGETARQWLIREFTNANTRGVYRSGLVSFCRANDIKDLDAYVRRAQSDNQVLHDIQGWLTHIQNAAPYTRQSYMNAVRQFLNENGIEVDDASLQRTRQRRSLKRVHSLTDDRIPTHQELRRIMDYLPVNGRAFFLLLASSGLRISEALGLEMADLDLAGDPPSAYTRREVSGGSYGERYIFMSYEARDAIRNWLAVKPTRRKRGITGDQSFSDILVFDLSDSAVRAMWRRALEHANLNKKDPRTGHHVLHIHTLRKWFRSQSRINRDYLEALLGHFTNKLDLAYLRTRKKDIAKEYLACMKNVSVYGVQMDERLAQVETENRVLKEELRQLQTQMHQLQQSRTQSDNVMDALFQDEEVRTLIRKKLRELYS
jgi:integrase